MFQFLINVTFTVYIDIINRQIMTDFVDWSFKVS